MIILWILMGLWGLFLTIINLFPDVPVISQIGTLVGYAGDLGEGASGFGAWMPWSVFPIAITILLSAIAISITIKVLRLVVKTISFRKLDL